MQLVADLLCRKIQRRHTAAIVKACGNDAAAEQMMLIVRQHHTVADLHLPGRGFMIHADIDCKILHFHAGFLLLFCQQMRRRGTDDAGQRLFAHHGHFTADQHTRIDAADRAHKQKAFFINAAHHKADPVDVCVEQNPCFAVAAGFANTAKRID